MKQLLQSIRNGQTEIVDVPAPRIRPGHLLIQTRVSLISAGTERMLVEFGKAGWIEKARQQPDKVRQVADKVRTDGLLPTLDAVRSKLDQPIPLGYCNVGTVLEVGAGVEGFAVGDRVLSNGHHAELVCVSRNLCANIPDSVPDESAPFGVVAAIGLQGIRLAQPTLGEAFVVSGLGLIGLLTVQLLRAHGCRVLGLDFNPARLAMAESFGAETFNLANGDPLSTAMAFSRGRGVDGVLITAATKSDEPVHQAANMCRQRGRIVLVGVAGLQLSRDDFYKKELSFQVSCSYGPGRHDPEYEQEGHDYPPGFVRWTEQRNFEAVLDMMRSGQVDPTALITHRYPFASVEEAYALISGTEPSLGVLLKYPDTEPAQLLATTVSSRAAGAVSHPRDSVSSGSRPDSDKQRRSALLAGPVRVAFMGAGNFASQVLIPAFRDAGAQLVQVASPGGLSASIAARRYGIREVTSDLNAPLEDPNVDALVIATRHDSHADLVCRAIDAGKHVFVEKPLCLTEGELARIRESVNAAVVRGDQPLIMVGYNRRFAPHVVRMRALLQSANEAKAFVMTVNAGAIPGDHWVHDPAVGGGRIVGEGCHFIDLLRFLCGHPITDMQAMSFGARATDTLHDDKVTITLGFADGSIGTVHYLANGHRAVAKERLEVFCGGRLLQLENFRRLRMVGWAGPGKMNLWRQDKGHRAGVAAFLEALRTGGPQPIPEHELFEVAQVTLDARRSAESREPISYHPDPPGTNRGDCAASRRSSLAGAIQESTAS